MRHVLRQTQIAKRSGGIVPGPNRVAAFTLIELLVAILIIGLITTLVLTIASKGVHQQKKANTLAIMRGTTLAIEQFAAERPLRNTYGIRRVEVTSSASISIEPTFGDLPPYQLAGGSNSGSLSARTVVEQNYLNASQNRPATLSDRLWWDLRPNPSVAQGNVVRIDTNDPKANDDNRALYTYLRVFSARSLDQIPRNALKPLTRPLQPEMVNPTGAGFNIGATPNGAIDVLGIHDAWGVPLDYMLYVKLERYPRDDANNPNGWRVVDRIAVLRSHGMDRDAYDAGSEHSGGDIYSVPMPEPAAKMDANGALQNWNRGDNGGWIRAKGAPSVNGGEEEDYEYVPALD
ncbi:MAG: prepilin-type N-terminal cleavage/methylation domain-containing protein [Phycisphaerales bacterium]|nr:prepilin-type N-terminal cleavage/methylation domain-containing protein [Phycisphaerales bacterium]